MEQRKTALVTGASRGIGRAIALQLAKDGCNVAVIYAGSEQAAQDTCAEIEALGVQSLCIRCDVSDSQQCAQAVAALRAAGLNLCAEGPAWSQGAVAVSQSLTEGQNVPMGSVVTARFCDYSAVDD